MATRAPRGRRDKCWCATSMLPARFARVVSGGRTERQYHDFANQRVRAHERVGDRVLARQQLERSALRLIPSLHSASFIVAPRDVSLAGPAARWITKGARSAVARTAARPRGSHWPRANFERPWASDRVARHGTVAG